MIPTTIEFNHEQIGKAQYNSTGETTDQSPPVTAYVQFSDTWPTKDQLRLRKMTFRDLEREFGSLERHMRLDLAEQLQPFIVAVAFN